MSEDGKTLSCSRCPNRIDPHQERYIIGFSKPMKRMEWSYLCEGCAEELRGWLRIPARNSAAVGSDSK